MKPWLIGGIVAVAVAAGGYVALDQYAQRRAPAEVDALIAASGQVSGTHGPVAYSLWNDRLTVATIELQAKDPAALGWRKLQAAHLEVAGLDPLRIKALLTGRWNALHHQPSPTRLDYTGFTLEASDGTVFTAGKMAMAEPGFEAVPMSSAVPSATAMVTGLTTRSLDVSDIKITVPSAQGSSDIAIESITAKGIGKGRLDSLNIQRISAKGANQPSDGPAEVKIDGVAVSGLDHRNVIDLAYDREVRDEPLRALWDDITVTTVSVGDQAGEMKLDRLTLGSVKAKRGNSWQDVSTSLAAGKVEVDSLDFKLLKNRPAHFVMGKLRFSGIEPGRIGAASLDGITVEAENDTKVTFAGADLQDLSYSGWTKLGGLEDWMKLSAKPPRLSLRRFGLGTISVTQRGKELGSLGAFTATTTLDDERLPIASSIKIDKLSLTREVLHQGDVGQEIAALGYNQLSLDFLADGTYDKATSDMVVRETLAVGPEVGKLMISVKLNKVPTGLESGTQEEQMRRIMGMTIEKGEIRYEDESLVERALRRTAVKAGLTSDQMKEAAQTQLRTIKQSMPPGSRNGAMLDTLAAFIQKPRSLVLSIEPPRPVSVQQFIGIVQTNPMEIPIVLGLSLR